MRTVLWAPEALRDFEKQIAYIAGQSTQNANLVADRIEAAAAALGVLPTGRFSRMPGLYEKVVPGTPHIIAYARTDTTIVILRVIHGARNWTAEAWPDDGA